MRKSFYQSNFVDLIRENIENLEKEIKEKEQRLIRLKEKYEQEYSYLCDLEYDESMED